MLVEVQRHEDGEHIERQTLNTLNKEAKKRMGIAEGENDWTLPTFETTLNLKVFSLISNECVKVSNFSRAEGSSTSCIEVSLAEILNEEQWQGRRLYKMRVNKKFSLNLRPNISATASTLGGN